MRVAVRFQKQGGSEEQLAAMSAPLARAQLLPGWQAVPCFSSGAAAKGSMHVCRHQEYRLRPAAPGGLGPCGGVPHRAGATGGLNTVLHPAFVSLDMLSLCQESCWVSALMTWGLPHSPVAACACVA
jgi:hypothetical protein